MNAKDITDLLSSCKATNVSHMSVTYNDKGEMSGLHVEFQGKAAVPNNETSARTNMGAILPRPIVDARKFPAQFFADKRPESAIDFTLNGIREMDLGKYEAPLPAATLPIQEQVEMQEMEEPLPLEEEQEHDK